MRIRCYADNIELDTEKRARIRDIELAFLP